jgi:hypothetical protein
MPVSINLPADFQAAAALRDYPQDPAVQAFLKLLRAGVLWSPRKPRLLLAIARRLKAPLSHRDVLTVVSSGFQAKYVASALSAIARAWRLRGDFIYADGRNVPIIGGDDAAQRYGAPEWFGQSQPLGGSILDLARPSVPSAEPTAAPPPPAPAPTAPPPRPATPSFITR